MAGPPVFPIPLFLENPVIDDACPDPFEEAAGLKDFEPFRVIHKHRIERGLAGYIGDSDDHIQAAAKLFTFDSAEIKQKFADADTSETGTDIPQSAIRQFETATYVPQERFYKEHPHIPPGPAHLTSMRLGGPTFPVASAIDKLPTSVIEPIQRCIGLSWPATQPGSSLTQPGLRGLICYQHPYNLRKALAPTLDDPQLAGITEEQLARYWELQEVFVQKMAHKNCCADDNGFKQMDLFNFHRMVYNRFLGPYNNFTHTLYYQPTNDNHECVLALRKLMYYALIQGNGQEAHIGVHFGLVKLRKFDTIQEVLQNNDALNAIVPCNGMSPRTGAKYSEEMQEQFAETVLTKREHRSWTNGKFPPSPERQLELDEQGRKTLDSVINICKCDQELAQELKSKVDVMREGQSYVALIVLTAIGMPPILLQVHKLTFSSFPNELKFILTNSQVKKMVIGRADMASAIRHTFDIPWSSDNGVIDVQAINGECPLKPFNKGRLESADFLKIAAFQYHGLGTESTSERQIRLSLLNCLVDPDIGLDEEAQAYHAHMGLVPTIGWIWTTCNNPDALCFCHDGRHDLTIIRSENRSANFPRRLNFKPTREFCSLFWQDDPLADNSAPFDLDLEQQLILLASNRTYRQQFQKLFERYLESREVGLQAVARNWALAIRQNDELKEQGDENGYFGDHSKYRSTDLTVGVQDQDIQVFSEFIEPVKGPGADELHNCAFSFAFNLAQLRADENANLQPGNKLGLLDSVATTNINIQFMTRPGLWKENHLPSHKKQSVVTRERRLNRWQSLSYATKKWRLMRLKMVKNPALYRPLQPLPNKDRPLGTSMWKMPAAMMDGQYRKYEHAIKMHSDPNVDLTEDLQEVHRAMPLQKRAIVQYVAPHGPTPEPKTPLASQRLLNYFTNKERSLESKAVQPVSESLEQDVERISYPYKRTVAENQSDLTMDDPTVKGLDPAFWREWNVSCVAMGNVGHLDEELEWSSGEEEISEPPTPAGSVPSTPTPMEVVPEKSPTDSVEEIPYQKPAPPLVALSTSSVSTEHSLKIDESEVVQENQKTIPMEVTSEITEPELMIPFQSGLVPASDVIVEESIPSSTKSPSSTMEVESEPVIGMPDIPPPPSAYPSGVLPRIYLVGQGLSAPERCVSIARRLKPPQRPWRMDQRIQPRSFAIWCDETTNRRQAVLPHHPDLTKEQRDYRIRALADNSAPWDNFILDRDRIKVREHCYQRQFGAMTSEDWRSVLMGALQRFKEVAHQQRLPEVVKSTYEIMIDPEIHRKMPSGLPPSSTDVARVTPGVQTSMSPLIRHSTIMATSTSPLVTSIGTLRLIRPPTPPVISAAPRFVTATFQVPPASQEVRPTGARLSTPQLPIQTTAHPISTPRMPAASVPLAQRIPEATRPVPYPFGNGKLSLPNSLKLRALRSRRNFGQVKEPVAAYMEVPILERQFMTAIQLMSASVDVNPAEPLNNPIIQRIDYWLNQAYPLVREKVSVTITRSGFPRYDLTELELIGSTYLLDAIIHLEARMQDTNEMETVTAFLDLFDEDTFPIWRLICSSKEGKKGVIEAVFRTYLLVKIIRRFSERQAMSLETAGDIYWRKFRVSTAPEPLYPAELSVLNDNVQANIGQYVIQMPELRRTTTSAPRRSYVNVDREGSMLHRTNNGQLDDKFIRDHDIPQDRLERDRKSYNEIRNTLITTKDIHVFAQDLERRTHQYQRTHPNQYPPVLRLRTSGIMSKPKEASDTSRPVSRPPANRSGSTSSKRSSTSHTHRQDRDDRSRRRHSLEQRGDYGHSSDPKKRHHSVDFSRRTDQHKKLKSAVVLPDRPDSSSNGASDGSTHRTALRPIVVIKSSPKTPRVALAAQAASSSGYHGEVFQPPQPSPEEGEIREPTDSAAEEEWKMQENANRKNFKKYVMLQAPIERLGQVLQWVPSRYFDQNDREDYKAMIWDIKSHIFKRARNYYYQFAKRHERQAQFDPVTQFPDSHTNYPSDQDRFRNIIHKAWEEAWEDFKKSKQPTPDITLTERSSQRPEESDDSDPTIPGPSQTRSLHSRMHHRHSTQQNVEITDDSCEISWTEDSEKDPVEDDDIPLTPVRSLNKCDDEASMELGTENRGK